MIKKLIILFLAILQASCAIKLRRACHNEVVPITWNDGSVSEWNMIVCDVMKPIGFTK